MSEEGFRNDEDFRECFSEEIWEIILDEMMILSVEDVQHWRRSSPFFRRLLQRKRVQWLFPQVLDILYKNGYLIPKTRQYILMGEDEPFTIIAEQTVAPSFYSRLGNGGPWGTRPPTILKLRLVCKMWKTAVDNFYRERLYQGKAKDISFGKAFEQVFMSTHFSSSYPRTSIRSFLSHFKESTRYSSGNLGYSPFLLKGCIFRFSKYNATAEGRFRAHVSFLLRKYGRHLEKCTFDFRMVDDCRPYLKKLVKWLYLVPNLKQLEIVSWVHPPSEPYIRRPVMEALLRNLILRMAHLEHLVMERVDFPLSAGVLSANNHVTRLDMTYSETIMECVQITEELPNLSYLKATIYSNYLFDDFANSQFKCSLKTLELLLYFVEYPPIHVFKVVQKMFGETLETFSLIIVRNALTTCSHRKSAILKDCELLQKLYLPSVATFQVDVKESYFYMYNTIKCSAYLAEAHRMLRVELQEKYNSNMAIVILLLLLVGFIICF